MITANTSAGGQLAGYLWQPAEACLRCLTEEPETLIRIEVDDDLSVASLSGEVWSCEQLKHSELDQTISEENPIWWKAIDAWIRGSTAKSVKLRLLTTAALHPDSLLASCYQPTAARPWDALLDEMDKRAKDAPNQELNKKGVYQRWIGLSLQDRRKLLTRIEIASSQGRLAATNEKLDEALMEQRSVSPLIVARVRKSYVGAFMTRLMASLDSGGFEISVHEMNKEFLEAYARNATPGIYDFPELAYDAADIKALQIKHHQHLIPQLAAIDRDQTDTVTRALDSWFRARTRRQDFLDGSPHEIQDLERHDQDLRTFCFTNHEEYSPVVDSEHAKNVGRQVHAACMKYQPSLGRSDPPLEFAQGSYHELSNSLRVKWNPLYGGK
ncbi:MAG: hypothetical protein KKA54_08070 [Proteobacteria bacterium]|nr:hypothetical protein [Pseudomonadota bacterium]